MKLSTLIAQYKDSITGGKGDTTDIESLDKKQLAIGILVEKEHTNNVIQALEISCDHLTEDPLYYTKLIKSGIVDEKEALDLYKKLYTENKMKKSELKQLIKESILDMGYVDVKPYKKKIKEDNGVHPAKAFFNENYKDIIKVFRKYDKNEWTKFPEPYKTINRIVEKFTDVIFTELGENNPKEYQYSSAWEYFANNVLPGHIKPSYESFKYAIRK